MPERNVVIDEEFYNELRYLTEELQDYLTAAQEELNDNELELFERTTDLLDRVLFAYEGSLEQEGENEPVE